MNVVPGVTSAFRWHGRAERARESLLVIKVPRRALASLARALTDMHPYEVPEALVLTPALGLSSYVRWLAAAGRVPARLTRRGRGS